jgi:hypothetical protein
MPLAFLLDEHFRGPLWQTILSHNMHSANPIDVRRVGEDQAPRTGTRDDELLMWAERKSRILVTRDRNSMPGFLRLHLEAGRHSPGVLIVRDAANFASIIETLELIAHTADAIEYRDSIGFIP